MQVPSSPWPSAASAISLHANRDAINSQSAPASTSGIEHVAKGEQTQDRDANEQYAGNGGQPTEKPQIIDEAAIDPNPLLHLDADSGEEPSQIDLQG